MNRSSLTTDSSGLVTQVSRWSRSGAAGTTRREAITSAKVVNVNHAPRCQVANSDRSTPSRDAAGSHDAQGITERSAYAIVNDRADAGYVLKERDARRNR